MSNAALPTLNEMLNMSADDLRSFARLSACRHYGNACGLMANAVERADLGDMDLARAYVKRAQVEYVRSMETQETQAKRAERDIKARGSNCVVTESYAPSAYISGSEMADIARAQRKSVA